MRKLIILLFIILYFTGCKTDVIPADTPECIHEMIDEIAEGDVWNPPAKIYRYEYKGQKVFYFPSKCCDIPSFLYDEECNFLCSPDGGISDEGDGQCSDFFNLRTDEILIWEDIRE